jgi:hypothetical protein
VTRSGALTPDFVTGRRSCAAHAARAAIFRFGGAADA